MAKKKKNDEMSIAELIKATPDGGVIEKPKRIPKRRRWIKWALAIFAVLWVIGTVSQPKDKATSTGFIETTNPDVAFVGNIPTNTPRASITPIIRETITAEARASMVARAMATPTPTDGVAGTATNTMLLVTDSPTNTDMPTNTPSPTPLPTQSGVREIADEGVVTGQSVRVRSCASTECAELGRLFNGTTFPITGSVGDGQSIEGNRLWYQITYNGQGGYVSATLVGLVSAQPVVPVGQNISPVQPTQPIVAPVSAQPVVPVGQNISPVQPTQPIVAPVSAQPVVPVGQNISPVQPTQPIVAPVSAQPVVPVGQNISPVQPTQPIVAPVSGWNCSGDRYNCPDFGSGGQFTCPQLFEYMSACPSDPSKLDRDRDGRFCETQCG